uniref:Uncharacterized protein n=1 Tax=Rhizophora mucronata TaxID=61149 RepID=A0A2P2QTP4_RHIMU
MLKFVSLNDRDLYFSVLALFVFQLLYSIYCS